MSPRVEAGRSYSPIGHAPLSMGAERAAAQGPAGAGAPAAAPDSSHSSHSLNPIKWVKKDSTNSTHALGNRSDLEEKTQAEPADPERLRPPHL